MGKTAIPIDTSPARADTSWRSTAELTTNVKIAVIQFAENRRKERHQFWLRLRHAVILIANDRTLASKKINGMALIRTRRFQPLRSTERRKIRLSSVFGRLQNPVLLVLSSKNGRFRRPSKPSASLDGRLPRLWKDSLSDVFSLW